MDLQVSLWLSHEIEWNGCLSCRCGHEGDHFRWAFASVFEFSELLEQVLSTNCCENASRYDAYGAAMGSGTPIVRDRQRYRPPSAGSPQPTHRQRTFRRASDGPETSEGAWDTLKKKAVAEYSEAFPSAERKSGESSFVIKILYRQNASWQGNLTWLEQQKTVPFRSCLELIRLMDEAVGAEDKATWSAWE